LFGRLVSCALVPSLSGGFKGLSFLVKGRSVLGGSLPRLGERGQVLTVTHLPQVAAQCHQHLFVHKVRESDTTRTAVADVPARLRDLAAHLSGFAPERMMPGFLITLGMALLTAIYCYACARRQAPPSSAPASEQTFTSSPMPSCAGRTICAPVGPWTCWGPPPSSLWSGCAPGWVRGTPRGLRSR